jgi:hypothetical protein
VSGFLMVFAGARADPETPAMSSTMSSFFLNSALLALRIVIQAQRRCALEPGMMRRCPPFVPAQPSAGKRLTPANVKVRTSPVSPHRKKTALAGGVSSRDGTEEMLAIHGFAMPMRSIHAPTFFRAVRTLPPLIARPSRITRCLSGRRAGRSLPSTARPG